MNGLTVIICCYNSAKRLPETLLHLARQDVPDGIPWEVLVVDNASTDGTGEVAEETWRMGAVSSPLRVVSQPVAGLSYAREMGIESAAYEFLLFCDDDNWLCSIYVARIYYILNSRPEVALVSGWGEPVCEATPPDWFADFSGPYGTGPQGIHAGISTPLASFYGAGTAIRKSSYHHLMTNGFRFLLSGRLGKKLTTGEDRELCYALTLSGQKLYYDPDLKFEHFIPKERSTFTYYHRIAEGCVPASIILKCYQLNVLDRVTSRPRWKNDHLWVSGMMLWAQCRKVAISFPLYTKKGYWYHLRLEVWLIFQTLWVWLVGRRQFYQHYNEIRNARYAKH